MRERITVSESSYYTKVSEEYELIEYFGSEPVESEPKDGYWCYELRDRDGLTLRVSFNVLAKSIQTQLLVGDREVQTVVHEGGLGP